MVGANNDSPLHFYHMILRFFVILQPERRLSRAEHLFRVRKVGTAQSTILLNGKALETTTASATENYRPEFVEG